MALNDRDGRKPVEIAAPAQGPKPTHYVRSGSRLYRGRCIRQAYGTHPHDERRPSRPRPATGRFADAGGPEVCRPS